MKWRLKVFSLLSKMKKYRVTLTAEEKDKLRSLIHSGKYKHTRLKRAQILLGADESEGGKKMIDTAISHAYDVSLRTIERTRQRFVEDSYEIALNGKPRPLNRERLFDGRVESQLLALRCSDVPEGSSRWTLKLLAEKMVELEYVPSITPQSVHNILKKHQSNHGE